MVNQINKYLYKCDTFLVASAGVIATLTSMGCCSGTVKPSDEEGGAQSAKKPGVSSTQISYTYIPGAVKHTDPTSSQLRTGWASERARKQHIKLKNYDTPTYKYYVLKSNDGASNNWRRIKKNKDDKDEAESVGKSSAGPLYATVDWSKKNTKSNYFGTDQRMQSFTESN